MLYIAFSLKVCTGNMHFLLAKRIVVPFNYVNYHRRNVHLASSENMVCLMCLLWKLIKETDVTPRNSKADNRYHIQVLVKLSTSGVKACAVYCQAEQSFYMQLFNGDVKKDNSCCM